MSKASLPYLDARTQERISRTLYEYFQISRHLPTLEVDFQKPWTALLLLRKYRYAFQLVIESAQSAYENLIPFLLTRAFLENRVDWLVYVIGGYALLELVNRVAFHNFLLAQNTVGLSYFGACYGFFLTVDPLHHSTRSSGKIISKITNTWFDFMTLVDTLTFNVVPALIGFLTATVAVTQADTSLLYVTLPSFFLITLFNALANLYASGIFKPAVIETREKSSTIATENLMQNALIRTTFTTETQLEKYIRATRKFFAMRTTSRLLSGSIITLTRWLSAGSVLLVALTLFRNESQDPAVSASLVVTYFLGIRAIPWMSRVLATILDAYIGLNDMWTYVRDFGTQTYPVLSTDTAESESQTA